MIVEQLTYSGRIIAIVISPTCMKNGVEFLTPQDALLQVGCMNWPKGHSIKPHKHLPFERITRGTQEVLYIKKGRLMANFYNDDRNIVIRRELGAGDFLCLLEGAHGFDVLEDIEMVEIKNGPYAGDSDKLRFESKPES